MNGPAEATILYMTWALGSCALGELDIADDHIEDAVELLLDFVHCLKIIAGWDRAPTRVDPCGPLYITII